jgi:hypothetical protein
MNHAIVVAFWVPRLGWTAVPPVQPREAARGRNNTSAVILATGHAKVTYGQRRALMKRIMVALAVALIATPALAQMGGMNLMDDAPQKMKTKEDVDRQRAAENAYRSTMKSIPDQKKATNDPWADVRGTSQSASAPKTRPNKSN